MPDQTRIVNPGMKARSVRTRAGEILTVPDDWELLAPGDAALTRKVKQAGPSWTVQVRKGRRTFSQGVWAPAATIRAAREAIEQQRATPAHQAKLARDRENRRRKEAAYMQEFANAIYAYLEFAPRYSTIAGDLSRAISAHACPVGSGTVARTTRIPIEQRAEAALIAWMRHQSSSYEGMYIARIEGARREVRRKIAQQSRLLLGAYRRGDDIDLECCPLYAALKKWGSSEAQRPE
jgi:hypothetical protein